MERIACITGGAGALGTAGSWGSAPSLASLASLPRCRISPARPERSEAAQRDAFGARLGRLAEGRAGSWTLGRQGELGRDPSAEGQLIDSNFAMFGGKWAICTGARYTSWSGSVQPDTSL